MNLIGKISLIVGIVDWEKVKLYLRAYPWRVGSCSSFDSIFAVENPVLTYSSSLLRMGL